MSERGARRAWLALVVTIGAGCTICPPSRARDGSIDSEEDASVYYVRDASIDADLAACPESILVHDDSGGTGTRPWRVGEPGSCAALGFEISESTRDAAEAAWGEACGAAMCILVAEKEEPLTEEQLERACAVETQLGPQTWVCRYE